MNFVTDLAIILIAASIFIIISKVLKQPPILGYIIAGFLVSPHLGLVPISNMEDVYEWSAIGIIFLMFAHGMEFSFKKLLKVGSAACVTAGIKCIGMFALALFIGTTVGWSIQESIFIGGLLSMSSTPVINKAYEDLGLKEKPYSPVLFGSLVFQDMIAILMMVLLSTFAARQQFAGEEMLIALGKFGFFILLWSVVGIYAIPSILNKAHKYLNNEIILIIAIGLCFLMVTVAHLAGFSSALGAFVMGSILSETIESERMERVMSSIKDLFGAIFFISVSMMVDISGIGNRWPFIFVYSIIAMLGIIVFSTIGALLSGQGIRNSIHISFSLAQLGEFAFIIAALGCAFEIIPQYTYPIIICVSLVTTFLTPYMIKAAGPVSDWLYRVLPEKIIKKLEPAKDDMARKESTAAQNEWRHLLRSYFERMMFFGIILSAIIIFSKKYFQDFIVNSFPYKSPEIKEWIVFALTLIVMLPFLYGFAINNKSEQRSAELLIKHNPHSKWLIKALNIIKIFLASGFLVITIVKLVHVSTWVYLFMVTVFVFALFLAHRSSRRFTQIEDRFFSNLHDKERRERAAKPITTSVSDKLKGYDVHIESVKISPNFSYIGKTLREMPFRHVSGVNIMEIAHGDKHIRIPRGSEPIYPHDTVVAVGTTEQLENFKSIIEQNSPQPEKQETSKFVVQRLDIEKDSFLAGKSLKESDLRASGCLVVSILRDDKFITNPKQDDFIMEGDKVWIAGEQESCEWFLN